MAFNQLNINFNRFGDHVSVDRNMKLDRSEKYYSKSMIAPYFVNRRIIAPMINTVEFWASGAAAARYLVMFCSFSVEARH